MKRVIFLVVILFLFGLFFVLNNTDQDNGLVNIQNMKRVNIGMDTTKVLVIMGKPSEKRYLKGELFYDYETPNGQSLQCQIIFDSFGKVIYKSPTTTEDP